MASVFDETFVESMYLPLQSNPGKEIAVLRWLPKRFIEATRFFHIMTSDH